MKHVSLLFFFLLTQNVSAQILNIPDPYFKALLLNTFAADMDGNGSGDARVDTNQDGEIQLSEALVVTGLIVRNKPQMTSLAGIENFINLTRLDCFSNNLPVLNIQALTNLRHLDCHSNVLTNLNLQGLTNLRYLNCHSNRILNLDLQGFNNMTTLICYGNTMATLNVQGLSNMEYLDCNSNVITSLNLQGLTNLKNLICHSNAIPNLNLQGLANLENLDCHSSRIASLNVQGLVNLKTMDTNTNLLTSLDAQVSNKLEILNCSYNRITQLNVQNLPYLREVNCIFNQITSLNAENSPNLTIIMANNNQMTSINLNNAFGLQTLNLNTNSLTSLDLQGLTNLIDVKATWNAISEIYVGDSPNLTRLDLYSNQLISLDLNNCSSLQSVDYAYNIPMTHLYLKNGRRKSFTFPYPTSTPNLIYICCDDEELQYLRSVPTYLPNCTVSSYCSFVPGGRFYTLKGDNILDTNTNGCDTNDALFPNLKYNIRKDTTIATYIGNTSGHYNISLTEGVHTIKPVLENPNYYTVSPDSIQITFPNSNSDTLTQNFCIVPNGVHRDLEAIILPTTAARPGFDANYSIVYKNKGTTLESDSLMLRFPDDIMDFVSANFAPSSIRHDTLVWYFQHLQPFEIRTISLTLNLNSPMETPPVNGGDTIRLQTFILPFTGDETPIDNRFSLRQTVVNAFDPNDKTCLEGEQILPTQVGDYLHYLIRFENTGSFAAQNIVVKDTIDILKFDIKTLEMTTASHDCRVRILNNRQVEFIFEHINLPFTAPQKHGFVAFKIKTKPNITVGNTFQNKADIFFDYNFPITTNTATTQITAPFNSAQGGKSNSIIFEISPNPVSDILNLKTNTRIEKCEIYDALGRVVDTPYELHLSSQQINVAYLPKGVYFIKIFSANGFTSQKFIKK
jgi:Secretion system C-terminal sorting domain